MKIENCPLSRQADLVVQEFEDELLVYDLIEHKAFCLNKTSALVWNLCNGKRSIPDIVKEIEQKVNLPIEQTLVWFALEQLKSQKLIENKIRLPIELERLSRREIIRKTGLAATVALPMIFTIVAPNPINAASSGCTSGASPTGQAGLGGFCRCVFPGTPLGATCGIGDAAFSSGETCKPGCICTHSNFGNGTCG